MSVKISDLPALSGTPESDDVLAIVNDSVTKKVSVSELLGAGNVVTDKISITSAEILALNTSPVELIAAPGAGKIIQVLMVTGRIHFDSAAYSSNTVLTVQDAATNNLLFYDTLFSGGGTLLEATEDKIVVFRNSAGGTVAIPITDNSSVELSVLSGNPAGGSGTLDIYITYLIVDL